MRTQTKNPTLPFMSLKKHGNTLTRSRDFPSSSARTASAVLLLKVQEAHRKHFISLSNKFHNRNDSRPNEKPNHCVGWSHHHSWLRWFTSRVTGFEQYGNYFTKFTFPSFLALGSKKQESNFHGIRCQRNANTEHQLQEFLGLGHPLDFAEPKPRRTAAACLVAQDDPSHVKHACDRSSAPRSTTAICQ